MLSNEMRTGESDSAPEQQKRAGSLLRQLLERHGRGAKAELGRKLVDDGYRSGEQLPRKWMAGEGFGRAQQRTAARLVRELGIADVSDSYFDRDVDQETAAATPRHASLAAVLARRPLRPETVKLLTAQAGLLEIDDPGEQHWNNMATIFEGLYAASDAVRGPTRPRAAPSRRR